MNALPSLFNLDPRRFETVPVLKLLNATSRELAELKGLADTLPNPRILINTLGLQDAKDSSEIEQIYTTLDDIFTGDALPSENPNPAAKEVLRYREALNRGQELLNQRGLITIRTMEEIQAALECSNAGVRKLPGTVLKDGLGRTVYTPPEPNQLPELLRELERFINDPTAFDADPLIKMALLHYQFESIHPFYDGNGRTGRILNVLYLVQQKLLRFPVLYQSRHIVETKPDYYRLLRTVRTEGRWEEWVLYMLESIHATARSTIHTVGRIRDAHNGLKRRIRDEFKFYSHELLNNLFQHPYTTVNLVMRDTKVSRPTATKYLEALSSAGILNRQRRGRSNLYINHQLIEILSDIPMQSRALMGRN